ncbi:MAG TPA: alpha/beta fold hydrolase [Xanthobacteraceae bacterium]|jgi:pimeloyl-ACP methyl ester carboxylesterase|nr:alpha/beta fold hydrolase [Xanthobacteraceae bacterium]
MEKPIKENSTSEQSRRTILKAAGAVGAGLLSGISSTAQAEGAAAATPLTGDIWSNEYWTMKGDVKLYIFRKRVGAPVAGEKARPVLFMVHGSSNSSRTSYDLEVPGHGEYSMMNVFARNGFDVWTMDHEGYGYSSRSSGNSDIKSGVEDLKLAAEVVKRETGQSKAHYFGTSSGAIRAAAYAQAQPDRADRLVLSAFTYKGTGSPTLTDRAKQLEYYRTHNTRLRDSAMVRSIFTRDSLASSYDPAMIDAMVQAELKYGDQVPTGTYLDMTANLPLVDPLKITSPVLLIRGDHDGIATVEDLEDFFRQLPNGDRQFVIVPQTAHNPTVGKNRFLYWHAVNAFLTMPPAVA